MAQSNPWLKIKISTASAAVVRLLFPSALESINFFPPITDLPGPVDAEADLVGALGNVGAGEEDLPKELWPLRHYGHRR